MQGGQESKFTSYGIPKTEKDWRSLLFQYQQRGMACKLYSIRQTCLEIFTTFGHGHAQELHVTPDELCETTLECIDSVNKAVRITFGKRHGCPTVHSWVSYGLLQSCFGLVHIETCLEASCVVKAIEIDHSEYLKMNNLLKPRFPGNRLGRDKSSLNPVLQSDICYKITQINSFQRTLELSYEMIKIHDGTAGKLEKCIINLNWHDLHLFMPCEEEDKNIDETQALQLRVKEVEEANEVYRTKLRTLQESHVDKCEEMQSQLNRIITANCRIRDLEDMQRKRHQRDDELSEILEDSNPNILCCPMSLYPPPPKYVCRLPTSKHFWDIREVKKEFERQGLAIVIFPGEDDLSKIDPKKKMLKLPTTNGLVKAAIIQTEQDKELFEVYFSLTNNWQGEKKRNEDNEKTLISLKNKWQEEKKRNEDNEKKRNEDNAKITNLLSEWQAHISAPSDERAAKRRCMQAVAQAGNGGC
jgi:hypothetical protein